MNEKLNLKMENIYPILLISVLCAVALVWGFYQGKEYAKYKLAETKIIEEGK